MSTSEPWALALFDRSVIKQEKFGRIVSMLDDVSDKRCLDIGADNGVISYLLRKRGGDWFSADLDAVTVESIRGLVREKVMQVDGATMPFPSSYFDVVVIVDFLEHIHTDVEFAEEVKRVLKPGGKLIVNVPHLKPRSVLNRLRQYVGLTDEKHGHVRPGYSISSLRDVLGAGLVVDRQQTYSKVLSEAIDTALNFMYEVLRGRTSPTPRSQKGPVMTEVDVRKFRKQLYLLSAVYPLLWALVRLDRLLVFQTGYRLIVRATRV